MEIDAELEREIRRMVVFISIFYAPWFLTCEFADTAAFKVSLGSWAIFENLYPYLINKKVFV